MTAMTTTADSDGLRRVTGWLLVLGAVTFAVAATILSSTFNWPDILREPPEVVLPAFVAGGTSLVWTWFAVAWTYAILLVPILLGEHLGQLLAIAWSITISVLILRTGILWRWVGWAGLVASLLYLFNQGDILATAVPGFPVFDLAGFIGSSLWAIWLIALGLAVLRAPIRRPTAAAAPAPSHTRS